MPLPLEVVGRGQSQIDITWEDDHVSHYTARELRIACRCASCIEEMTGRQLLAPDSIAEAIVATDIQLVGQYALAIVFSDGHATGIYNFRDLRENCRCAECSALRGRAST